MVKTKHILNFFLLIGLFFASAGVFAATHEPLTMDQAFRFSAKVRDSQTIVAQWQMAPGYILYRKHLQISTKTKGVQLGAPLYPQGITKTEPGFGSFEVYQDKVSIPVPVLSAKGNKIKILARFQGCSEEGFCYPPTDKSIILDLTKPDTVAGNDIAEPIGKALDTLDNASAEPASPPPLSEQDKATQLLSSGHYFTIILTFLGFGLLLAFTPCVLPMIPILSGIIVGQNRESLTTRKAFSLSLIYVLSMSFTYSIAGVLIGYLGGSLQSAFQTPWLLATFSLLFVLLALSFFGLYELKLPARLQTSLTRISNQQQSGTYIGVAIMGCIATLVVSPCVTPALVGALGYIGKTGNAFLGGAALFALGFGMGLPLLIIGTAGGKFLPKAGVWMDQVKNVFGVLLLAMAIWMISRILPGPVTLALWACLFIISACFMGIFTMKSMTTFPARLNHGFAVVFFVYGVLLIIGAAMGNSNPLQPLQLSTEQYNVAHLQNDSFKHIADVDELSTAINDAKSQKKLVMLDFSAKWCTSCKIMENRTFNNPDVAKALANFVTLKADVTANDLSAKTLEKRYSVVAPPTLLFFDVSGKEIPELRIVGDMGPKEFLEHLQVALRRQG